MGDFLLICLSLLSEQRRMCIERKFSRAGVGGLGEGDVGDATPSTHLRTGRFHLGDYYFLFVLLLEMFHATAAYPCTHLLPMHSYRLDHLRGQDGRVGQRQRCADGERKREMKWRS